MVAVDLLRMVLVLAVPFVATRSLPAVFVLSFAIATAGVFFEPAKLAMLPEIVPPGQAAARQLAASPRARTSPRSSAGLSPALLLAAVSTSAAFRLDAVTFASRRRRCCSCATGRRRARRRSAPRARSGTSSRGLPLSARDRGLRANTAMIVVCVAGLGAAYPLTFLFAVNVLDGGTRRVWRAGGGRRRRLPRRLARAGGALLSRAQRPGHDRRTRRDGRLPRPRGCYWLRAGWPPCRSPSSASPTRSC